jgi:2-dehydropantoate 2-reductase
MAHSFGFIAIAIICMITYLFSLKRNEVAHRCVKGFYQYLNQDIYAEAWMQINKIALFGAGATGTIIGALVSKSGLDITLVSADKDHVTALQNNGAHIIGGMDIVVPVTATTPQSLEGKFDLIIYSVKNTHDNVALPQVLEHLHPGSVVLTTQNGVPEEKVASVVGTERTIGGSIVGWAASLPAPGVPNLAGVPDSMLYRIGELDGSITPRLKAVKSVIEAAGSVELSTDLSSMRWTKLLINVSMSGLSAALGCTFGEILDDEKAIETALCLKLETLRVAEKCGITISEANGQGVEEFLKSMRTDPERGKAQLRRFFDPQRAGKPSMLQDLEKGRLTEVEGINGFLWHKAREVGVQTPVNDAVLGIIRDIQNGKAKLTMENLGRIKLTPFSNSL